MLCSEVMYECDINTIQVYNLILFAYLHFVSFKGRRVQLLVKQAMRFYCAVCMQVTMQPKSVITILISISFTFLKHEFPYQYHHTVCFPDTSITILFVYRPKNSDNKPHRV